MDGRRSSTDSGSVSLQRSRTWSDDVQKHWTLPVPAVETMQQRVERYTSYFSLNPQQMEHVFKELLSELQSGLVAHKGDSTVRSVKMLDTCVSHTPDGTEKGSAYSVHFSGPVIRAVKAKLEANGRVTMVEQRLNMTEEKLAAPKGLMDKDSGALTLFDYIAACVEDLMRKCGDLGTNKPKVNVGFVVGFPLRPKGLRSASIMHWTKGFETGRSTNDPVEGLDLATLLDMAFWRKDINAKTILVTNDAICNVMACEYERPKKLPPCTVSFVCGVGVNGVYQDSSSVNYGYQGSYINTELGGFDKGLPVTDVDLEVDFADDGGHGIQMLEKMTGGGYLGEICRRLVVKVFQNDAPLLAWSRKSLPTAAAALCVADSTPDLHTIRKLLNGLWDWEVDSETIAIVKKLFTLVFERSAALSAICIAALAKKSGRLQPAMGGVTVAVDATLHAYHRWYSDLVRKYMKDLLADTASFVHLYVLHDGVEKGGAIMTEMSSSRSLL